MSSFAPTAPLRTLRARLSAWADDGAEARWPVWTGPRIVVGGRRRRGLALRPRVRVDLHHLTVGVYWRLREFEDPDAFVSVHLPGLTLWTDVSLVAPRSRRAWVPTETPGLVVRPSAAVGVWDVVHARSGRSAPFAWVRGEGRGAAVAAAGRLGCCGVDWTVDEAVLRTDAVRVAVWAALDAREERGDG